MADEPALRVPDSELDFDSDLIFTHKGTLFTGIAYEDVAGHVLSEVSYSAGKQEGWARDWDAAGVLRGESLYRQGVLHGPVREFDQLGVLIHESHYAYGIRVSSNERAASGEMLDTFRLDPDSAVSQLLERYRQTRRWPE